VRRSRLHGVGGSVLLALAGLLWLGSPLSRSVLTGSVRACITESSGTAWLGIHLRVLAESSACPQGSYAPGPHFIEAAHVSIALSGSTLVAAVVLLLWALGLGLWVRRALETVRVWVTRRLGLTGSPVLPITLSPRAPMEAVVADLRGAVLAHLQHRRGPPALVPA